MKIYTMTLSIKIKNIHSPKVAWKCICTLDFGH